MMIALNNGFHLSTSQVDARERFENGKFREATRDECVAVLRSIPTGEIQNSPMAFQALAISIARLDAYVGKLVK